MTSQPLPSQAGGGLLVRVTDEGSDDDGRRDQQTTLYHVWAQLEHVLGALLDAPLSPATVVRAILVCGAGVLAATSPLALMANEAPRTTLYPSMTSLQRYANNRFQMNRHD